MIRNVKFMIMVLKTLDVTTARPAIKIIFIFMKVKIISKLFSMNH